MMKRITALVLALALVLGVSTALAWSCPNCGNEMNGNFCSDCGAKKPENICPSCGTNFGDQQLNFCTECGTKLGASAAAPTAEPTAAPTAEPTAVPEAEEPAIAYATQTESGAIGVVWKPDGQQTYTVEFILRQSDDPYADREAHDSYYLSTVTDSTGVVSTGRVFPGEDYWIGLFDEQGRGRYIPFEGEETGVFEDFVAAVLVGSQYKIDGEIVTTEAFSLEEIEAGTECGLSIVVFYENKGDAQERAAHIVIEGPNGAAWPMYGNIKFSANTTNGSGWNHVALTDYFDAMEDGYGEIACGEYTVSFYLGLELVGTASFRVNETVAVPQTTADPAEETAAPSDDAADDRADLDQIIPNGDGTVTVTWTGGTPPYAVRYLVKQSDDYEADKAAADEFGLWIAERECQETSYTLNYLKPGQAYWIIVQDANSKGQYRAYEPEAAPTFTDFATTMVLIPRTRVGETRTDIPCIPADQAGLGGDTEYGAYLTLDYNNPGDPREMFLQVALTLPNGAVCVTTQTKATFNTGEREIGWSFYDMDWFLETTRETFGAIPAGDILVEVYLDGKLAGSGTLPVKTLTPVNITGMTSLGKGKYSLAWEDNGSGPYDVHYFEHFSDDMEADRKDDRGTGRWIEETDLAGTQCEMNYLVPGRSYWITVTDSNGAQGVITYDVPAAGTVDLGVVFEVNPRKKVGEEYTDLLSFSAADFAQAEDASYGLYLEMSYNERSVNEKLFTKWTLTLPDGVTFCFDASDLTWFASGSAYWTFFDLDWTLSNVERWYGELIKGEYRVNVYPEGQLAGSFTFNVGE